MLLILSQKENAKQAILILVIMNVYMISSITLFSLTFCHCGPVFLSLLKCISSDGKSRGGAVIWVLLSISLEGTGILTPYSTYHLRQTWQHVSLPWTVGDTYLNLIKIQVFEKFYPKITYFACKLKKMHLPYGPLKSVQDWVIHWSRKSPLWITSVL